MRLRGVALAMLLVASALPAGAADLLFRLEYEGPSWVALLFDGDAANFSGTVLYWGRTHHAMLHSFIYDEDLIFMGGWQAKPSRASKYVVHADGPISVHIEEPSRGIEDPWGEPFPLRADCPCGGLAGGWGEKWMWLLFTSGDIESWSIETTQSDGLLAWTEGTGTFHEEFYRSPSMASAAYLDDVAVAVDMRHEFYVENELLGLYLPYAGVSVPGQSVGFGPGLVAGTGTTESPAATTDCPCVFEGGDPHGAGQYYFNFTGQTTEDQYNLFGADVVLPTP